MTEAVDKVLQRLKLIATQITGIDDETLSMFAEDAYLQTIQDGFKDEVAIRAAGYLAAHFAFVAFNKNSKVKKDQAAVLSREYFDSNGSDDYLAEYKRMKTDLDNGYSGSALVRFL